MVQKLDQENTSSTAAADLQAWFDLQLIQKSTKYATGILVFPHCALAEPISTFNLMAKKYRRQIVEKTKTVSAHNIVISFELVANVVISSAQYRRETWKSTLIELTPAGNCLVGTWELCEVTKGENLIELEQGSGVSIDIKENLKQSS